MGAQVFSQMQVSLSDKYQIARNQGLELSSNNIQPTNMISINLSIKILHPKFNHVSNNSSVDLLQTIPTTKELELYLINILL